MALARPRSALPRSRARMRDPLTTTLNGFGMTLVPPDVAVPSTELSTLAQTTGDLYTNRAAIFLQFTSGVGTAATA